MLEDAFATRLKSSAWILVNEGSFYLIPEGLILLPNPANTTLSSGEFISPNNLPWVNMEEKIAKKWFYTNKSENPLIKDDTIYYYDNNNCRYAADYVCCSDK